MYFYANSACGKVTVYLLFMTVLDISGNNWWIGAKEINNQWQWISPQYPPYAISHTYWYQNEPNNEQGIEDCMEMYPMAHRFRWNDARCDQTKAYICETSFSDDIFG